VEALLKRDCAVVQKRFKHFGPVPHQKPFDESGGRNAEIGCGKIAGGKEGSGFNEEQIYFSEKSRKFDGETGGEVGGIVGLQPSGDPGLPDEGRF